MKACHWWALLLPLHGAHIAAAVAVATPRRTSEAALPSRKGLTLLQQWRSRESDGNQRVRQLAAEPVVDAQPAKEAPFFTEDAQKMAEMPPYASTQPIGGHPNGTDRGGEPTCTPHCSWRCGPSKACDQSCQPLCAPPKCLTTCRKAAAMCETRCSPPRCAVVCPEVDCHESVGSCPKCRTVCSPPVCTTQCHEDCHTTCDKPSCTWSCKATECPKPTCTMNCSDAGRCSEGQGRLMEEAQRFKLSSLPDHTIVGEAVASLDPSTLYTVDKPPAPWEMTTTTTVPEQQQIQAQPTTTGPIGPVRALKIRWAKEDAEKRKRRSTGANGR